MGSDNRENMVRSAAALIGSRGIHATSFSDVLAQSGAPRGSIYHYFPEGKHQLAEEAIRWTSDQILAHTRTCGGTPRKVLACFVGLWRESVRRSGGTSGCPVAGVAIDGAGGDAKLEGTIRTTFRSWISVLAERLEATGVSAPRARSLATTALAGMEGALILCRAEGNSGPLDSVAEELMHLLPASRSGKRAARRRAD